MGRFRLWFLAINYKTLIFHIFFPLIFCLIYKNNATSISQILSKKKKWKKGSKKISYQNLSEEEKSKNREYGHERYKNL